MARKTRTYGGHNGTPLDAGAAQLRIALYHRASTLDQDPQLARTVLAAWAHRQGGQVALSIEETGSGARNDRPGLQRVLKAASQGEIDVVACWKLDRIGRSALDVLHNIQLLTRAGVRFVAVDQHGIDIPPKGNPMSQLMVTVLAAVAEFELSLIKERTRLGMARAKAKGRHLGRPKLRHPSAEKVVELRAAKKSWAEIAKELKCSIGVARLRAQEHQEAQAPQAQKENP